MFALYIENHGDISALKKGNLPLPEPGEREVRVHLKASSLNHLDLFVLHGIPGVKLPLPHIAGADGAGVVDKVGKGVTRWKEGDEVILDPGISCGRCVYCLQGEHSLCKTFHLLGEHRDGTFASHIVVPEENLFPKPAHLSFQEAAALPLTFLTAWRMLFTRGKMQAGETLLIHGIGGGVALACLQLALKAGLQVAVTSHEEEKLEKARHLGAHLTIHYQKERITQAMKAWTGGEGVDGVVDSVGKATWGDSLKCCRRGGKILTCGATTGPNPEEEIRLIFWKQLSILGSTMGSKEDIRRMLAFVAHHRITPIIDQVFPLQEGEKGYRRMEEGKQFGKIVFTHG